MFRIFRRWQVQQTLVILLAATILMLIIFLFYKKTIQLDTTRSMWVGLDSCDGLGFFST